MRICAPHANSAAGMKQRVRAARARGTSVKWFVGNSSSKREPSENLSIARTRVQPVLSAITSTT